MITKIMLDAVKYMLLEKMITAGIFNSILKFFEHQSQGFRWKSNVRPEAQSNFLFWCDFNLRPGLILYNIHMQ